MGTLGVLGDYYDPPPTVGFVGEYDVTPAQPFVFPDDYDYDTALWWKFNSWRDGYIKFDIATITDGVSVDLTIHGGIAVSYGPNWAAVEVASGDSVMISVQPSDPTTLALRSSYYWDGVSLGPSSDPTTATWALRDKSYGAYLSPAPNAYFLPMDATRTLRTFRADNGYLSDPGSSVSAGARDFLRQNDNRDEYIPTPDGNVFFAGPADAVANGTAYGDLPPGAPYPSPGVHLDFSDFESSENVQFACRSGSTSITGGVDAMYWQPGPTTPPYGAYPFETRTGGIAIASSISATSCLASMGEPQSTPARVVVGAPTILSCSAAVDRVATPFLFDGWTEGSGRLFVRADSSGQPLTSEDDRGTLLGTFTPGSATWEPFDESILNAALALEGGSTDLRKLQFFVEPEELFTGSTANVQEMFAPSIALLISAELPGTAERLMRLPAVTWDNAEGDPESVHRIFCRPGG